MAVIDEKKSILFAYPVRFPQKDIRLADPMEYIEGIDDIRCTICEGCFPAVRQYGRNVVSSLLMMRFFTVAMASSWLSTANPHLSGNGVRSWQ